MRRGLKWDDSFLFMFLLPLLFLVFLYFPLHVMLLVLDIRCGINVLATQTLMYFVLCLILDYWEIKHVLLLIFLSIVRHANLAKVKFYLFLIPHLVPHNVLILYIVMFRGLHLLFLMHITSTLLLSLITLVVLLGFTSPELGLKFFQSLSAFLHLLKLNPLPTSRSCALILAKNACLMSFRTFFKAKGSSLSVLVLQHHNKTVSLRGKIATFLMW